MYLTRRRLYSQLAYLGYIFSLIVGYDEGLID